MNKINNTRFFFLLLTGCLITLGLKAQTARWTIPPQYTSIIPYEEGMYKVKAGSKTGIVDNEGKVIVPVRADSITTMAENKALVLEYGNSSYRLRGILHRDGRMVAVTDEWYVDAYPFFSESKLPVHNKNGIYGFIDSNGILVIDFQYSSVRPFSEGWAAVVKGKSLLDKGVSIIKNDKKRRVQYVNENGEFLTLQGIKAITLGTTFKNGEAVVMTTNNKYFVINTYGVVIRAESDISLAFDEKYALETGEDNTKENNEQPPVYDGPTTFSENGLYGYQLEGKKVLPAQFTEAYPFSKGFALACVDNKYGLLRLISGDFECETKPGSLRATQSGTKSIDFVLSVPEGWADGSLELTCKTPDGTEANSTLPGNMNKQRVFSFILPDGERELALSGEKLIVWTSGMNPPSFTPDDLGISIAPAESKANANDMATVTVSLKNKSSKAIQFTATVVNTRTKARTTKDISLAGGQTERIRLTFNKIIQTEPCTITVTTSLDDKKVSRQVTLKPFFDRY